LEWAQLIQPAMCDMLYTTVSHCTLLFASDGKEWNKYGFESELDYWFESKKLDF